MRRTKVIAYLTLIVAIIFIAALYLLPRLGFNFFTFMNRGSVDNVRVLDGFEIQVFAEDLAGPRFIAFGPDGVLYAAERGEDRIVALPDRDKNGVVDEVLVYADGLDKVHSLAFYEGSVYAGLPMGVVRLTDTNGDMVADEQEVVYENLTPGQHNTRTVVFFPDGRMAVAIGSTCNVCEETDPFRAAVTIFDGPDGGGERVFASGLRNAVGLAVNPVTEELWASNNGRDLMGDDEPPETIHILRDGEDHGWPYCHAGRIEDPDIGFAGACEGVVKPEVEIQAHSAPLGIEFYTGESFPEAFYGDLFVAYHGSWNRTIPTGYKVVRIPMEEGEVAGPPEDFAWGWLVGEREISGRPVGLAVGPDGALYISDDFGGRIFRVQATP
jgi:glucose/arabinose dehydrogenase